MRQMATIRQINQILPHNNAERLEIAEVDGWRVIVGKGQYQKDDIICFCEVDSWIPHDVFPDLSKGKEPRSFNGVSGERLRSIKLRGELSQGLILPITNVLVDWEVGQDVTEKMGIQKWERPMNPQLAGQAKGYFPSFLRKTDQERIQNQFKRMTQDHFDDLYEVTLKVDGSSMTVYYNNGDVGVCSRNLELKRFDDEGNPVNEDNSFIKKFNELGIESKLKAYGRNIAIQGELWGSGINGNWEGISHHEFSVFDIFDIDEQKYLRAVERKKICEDLNLQHVPVIEYTRLNHFASVQDFLQYAERPSINNKVAEGVVFKNVNNPEYSFKAVSNSYLLNGGE